MSSGAQAFREGPSPEIRERFERLFRGEAPFAEFPLDVPLEERIDHVCRVLGPWRSGIRLHLNFVAGKIAEAIPYSAAKIFIYRLMGVRIGKGVFISPAVLLDPMYPGLIVLEDHCVLGWGSKIFAHEMSVAKYRVGRVTVGRGAVVGAFCVVRSGVTVGSFAQTPMNGYVFRDVPPGHRGRAGEPERV